MPPTSQKPDASSGGRLVSLVDGHQYIIPTRGLTLGRDPSCDVVLPEEDVSRKHAVIIPRSEGYELTDMSTNGVLVNNERVAVPIILSYGDVVQIGGEEFRFDTEDGIGSSLISSPPETRQRAGGRGAPSASALSAPDQRPRASLDPTPRINTAVTGQRTSSKGKKGGKEKRGQSKLLFWGLVLVLLSIIVLILLVSS